MTNQLVFWNSQSGRADEIGDLRELLRGTHRDWVDLASVTDLEATLAKHISGGCESVVAVGGDGTINAIVNAMMSIDQSSRPTLSIVPFGTANDFAGTLRIPDDPAAAVDLIRSQDAVPIDLVQIRGEGFERFYANIAAGGNCVRASEAITDEIKSTWGPFAYIRGAFDVLPDMTSYRITAKCDNEEFADLQCWAVLVANGKTNAGRIEVAPQASPADGLIDVIIIRDGTIADMVQIVANNLLGRFLECEQVIFRQVKSLKLHSAPTMRFTLDGEIIDEEPIQFNVVPGAIRIHAGTQNLS